MNEIIYKLFVAIWNVYYFQSGAVVGPTYVVPLMVLSAYNVGVTTPLTWPYQILVSTSYLSFGLNSYCITAYGFDRKPLFCDTEVNDYCHYKDPLLILKDLGMGGYVFSNQMLGLISFLFFYRATSYLALRYRLSGEFSSKFWIYFAKIFRKK